MDKIKLIQKIMPENAEILVRTHSKNEWFVHYHLNVNEKDIESIHKVYTSDLECELDKVIEIIKSNA